MTKKVVIFFKKDKVTPSGAAAPCVTNPSDTTELYSDNSI